MSLLGGSYTHYLMILCTALECEVGRVRLVGGVSENMGRIEVCNGSQWGTLCGNEDTTSPDPSDICKSLGFSGDSKFIAQTSTFLNSSNTIYYFTTIIPT